MKTNLFLLILGMLCLFNSAVGQSAALTGFNGRITFSGFANNGLYVRGTLKDFNDQTNQYIASQIDTGDIAWDNNGKRYAVVGVISSNATQAVVDLSRIGGGTHIPKGAGLVSRETVNGLTLIPAANSAGISAQLASRVAVHNAIMLNNLEYGNILFVSTFGNNATAKKGRLEKPYQTLAAAVNAAVSGDLIFVQSGTYTGTTNLWKPGVNWHFEDVRAGQTIIGTEYSDGNTALFRATSTGSMRITGNLRTSRLLLVDTADVNVVAEGYELGQVYIGAGAVRAKISINTKETKSALYVSGNAADANNNNVVSYKAAIHTPDIGGHYPIMFVNNGSTRPKRNSFQIEIGVVEITSWGDFYPTRGYIQARSVGHAYDSTDIYIKIGKGKFNTGSNWSLLGFAPYAASFGNTLQLHCDDCEFNNFSALSLNGGADFGFTPSNKDLVKITGRYKTLSKLRPLFTANPGNPNTTQQKIIFDGEFIATDTSLFVLPAASNYEFRGFYRTYESDDPVITANWSNGAYRPILRGVLITTPCVTPIISSVATTWYVAGCFETKTVTKDPDITFTKENEY